MPILSAINVVSSYLYICFRTGTVLSTVVISGLFVWCVLGPLNGTAHAISASPNPCTASACDPLCTTTITWSQGDPVTQINVSWNGGPEALFACAGGADTYSVDAPWIGCGSNTYEFRHYMSTVQSCVDATAETIGGLLGSVTVTGQGCNTGIQFDIDDDECEPDDQTCIDNRKVLISNKGTLPYTSVYQEGLPGTNPEKDRKIKITGSTTPNTDFWLRVLDPDDPSNYEPEPPPPIPPEDDNRDTTGPWGNGAEFEGCSDSSCVAKEVTSDQNGNFETVMTVTNRYAGDNYKLQGALDEDFSCSPDCCLSGTITAWKRVYVEKDRMYRRGGLLFESFLGSGCSPNCNKIKVYTWSTANVGDVIIVFDEISTGGQQRTVTAKTTSISPYTTLTLNTNLTGNYYASSRDANNNPIFGNGNSGGIGVVNSGFFEVDLQEIKQTFDEAYVEYKDQMSADSNLPYIRKEFFDSEGFPLFRFSQIWFGHKNPFDCNGCVGCCNNPQNYFHVFGVSEYKDIGATSRGSDFTLLGIKTLEDIFAGYCSRHPPCNAQDKTTAAMRRNVAHELAHHFGVNSCSSVGHDSNNAWCGGEGGSCVGIDPVCKINNIQAQWCAMHFMPPLVGSQSDYALCQMSSGFIRLDCSDLSSNSLCPSHCSDSNSVRTNTDPE